MEIPYTLCFCRSADQLLMLLRNREPNAGLWNGLGGKLTPDETPLAGVYREIMEEAGIDLGQARQVWFGGLVTWEVGSAGDPTRPSRGLYAFVADLGPDFPKWSGQQTVPEGQLAWQPVEWVCDPANGAVVGNIPYFLPSMLAQAAPAEYYCDYQGEQLREVVRRDLPDEVEYGLK